MTDNSDMPTDSLSDEWDTYLTNVRAEAWEMGFAAGINSDRVDAALHETREIDLNPYRASEET